MKSDLVDVALHFHGETEKAIKVSENGFSDSAFWLPKSQIEFERKERGAVIVTLPEWLAKAKGFI